MKLFIFIFYIILSFSSIFAEESHFKNISKIEMDVLRNDKVIGHSNYFFKYDDENMTVENNTKFIVDMFGVKFTNRIYLWKPSQPFMVCGKHQMEK